MARRGKTDKIIAELEREIETRQFAIAKLKQLQQAKTKAAPKSRSAAKDIISGGLGVSASGVWRDHVIIGEGPYPGAR